MFSFKSKLKMLCFTCFVMIFSLVHTSAAVSHDPKVLVAYFPYDFGLLRDKVTPVPDYQGWPIDRIEKDFMRFSDMGVDGVLVGLPIDGLAEANMAESYELFMDVLARHDEWPDIAFFVYVNEELSSKSEDFFKSWVVENLSSQPQKYLTLDGRPLVVFGPRLKWRFRHPALTIRLSAPEFEEWPIDTVKPMRGSASEIEAVWISPVSMDLVVTSERTLMRSRNAFEFEEKLRDVLEPGHVQYIILYSWNDYRGGTFLEPNSIDGYDMSRAVYRALHR